MVAWAEGHLVSIGSDGVGRLELAVLDDDGPRRRLLTARGYQALDAGVWARALELAGWSPPPVVPVPAGYEVRTTRRDDEDAGRMARLLNRAFGRTMHTAAEYRTFMERSPSFDERLNLVVAAPDGSFACHIAFTLDPVNDQAILEPVATDPDHRRRGLARLLIEEGLRLSVALGARRATVETGHAPAGNALYEACGFRDARHLTIWGRSLPS
jgi:predicted N-acetyltransferase YhbS